MSENYSLNSKFGLNVTPSKSNAAGAKKAEIKELRETDGNFIDNLTNYVKKYENVFNGNIEKEINMYIRQSMIVGMNLRAGETKRNFDVSI